MILLCVSFMLWFVWNKRNAESRHGSYFGEIWREQNCRLCGELTAACNAFRCTRTEDRMFLEIKCKTFRATSIAVIVTQHFWLGSLSCVCLWSCRWTRTIRHRIVNELHCLYSTSTIQLAHIVLMCVLTGCHEFFCCLKLHIIGVEGRYRLRCKETEILMSR